jgi:hypothetical protein
VLQTYLKDLAILNSVEQNLNFHFKNLTLHSQTCYTCTSGGSQAAKRRLKDKMFYTVFFKDGEQHAVMTFDEVEDAHMCGRYWGGIFTVFNDDEYQQYNVNRLVRLYERLNNS